MVPHHNAWLPLALVAFLIAALLNMKSTIASDSVGSARRNLANRGWEPKILPSLGLNPGDLDPSFGQSGKATSSFFGGSAFAFAAALQPDGKIIAAGGNSTTQNFSLARFLTDGSLDNGFGTAGRVTTAFNANNDFAYAQAVTIQPDGKIVAGGLANNSSGIAEFAIVRYLPNGSLDSSFGSLGKAITNISGVGDQLTALLVEPDGKILAVGSAGEDFAVVRYNADGTLDNSFGSSGKVITDFVGFPDSAQAVAFQPDAKILVAGSTITLDRTGGIRKRFGLVRYNGSGTIDASFGSSGKVVTLFNSEFWDSEAYALVVQPDAKIVVAGWTNDPQGGTDFALARYSADGNLDTTFGSAGQVTTDFSNHGNDEISSVALQSDGKIVAGGFSALRGEHQLFALSRYNSDGTLDGGFGLGGKLTTAFFSGGFDCNVSELLLQPDGKIVSVGWAFFTDGNHFALARYIGDADSSPTPTPTPTPSPSPTPIPLPLELFLNESGPVVNQVAALDSILFLKDPFHVINENNLLRTAIDPNTRVVIFVRNLQLLQGESSSSVVVRLLDSNMQNHDIPAEDVRLVPSFDFAQVIFRLPDHLPVDDFSLSVMAHGQISNTGILRIR